MGSSRGWRGKLRRSWFALRPGTQPAARSTCWCGGAGVRRVEIQPTIAVSTHSHPSRYQLKGHEADGQHSNTAGSYRNLIHPGRMLRLAEAAPTKQSSAVAGALIDMIVEDLAKARRASVGLTAEQIVSKVRRDSHVGSTLKHLLTEVKEQQKERLLLELIPSAYQEELRSEEFADAGVIERLVGSHRVVLSSAEESTKRRVPEEFVRVLREEDGERVIEYGDAFFLHLSFAGWPLRKERWSWLTCSIASPTFKPRQHFDSLTASCRFLRTTAS